MSQSSTALQKHPTDTELLKKILFKGDLSSLTPEQQIAYYIQRCERIGLDPYSKPFDFLEIADKKTGEKKIILYANKECAAQLTVERNISIERLERIEENGVYTVIAHVRASDGRTGINLSVAKVKGLEGNNYENAVKRCVTQAIRRTILMVCGLGDTDESEIPNIPNAYPLPFPEQEAVMTEQEALMLSHRASGLDQWACGRGLAMLLINICKGLEAAGVSEDTWRTWLPSGIQSRKELTEDQAREVFDDFTARLKLIHVCMQLGSKGVDKETMRMALPGGAKSVFGLTDTQTQEALKKFTHWLNSYNEVTEGSANNG